MICERLFALFETQLGVVVTANHVGQDKEQDDGEYDPANNDARLLD